MIPKWVEIAFFEMGESEIAGSLHNQKIIEYHHHTTLKATEDEVPWCSAFMCYVMDTANIKSTHSAAARSWLGWGEKLDKPRFGCIVIFSRGSSWQGHVGLYLDEDDQFIYVLGGNQSNKVSIRIYSKSKVLGYRWPKV